MAKSETVETFSSVQDAFDACREADRPLRVSVPSHGIVRKIMTVYPSGYSKTHREVTE